MQKEHPFGQYVNRWQIFRKKEKKYVRRENKLSDIVDRKRRKGTGVDSDQTQEEASSNLGTKYNIL